jgi:hypothetical protein
VLIRFEPCFVPRNAAHIASRLAVLCPLTGLSGDFDFRTQDAISDHTHRLIKKWRSRLVQLRDSNWTHLVDSNNYRVCLNCNPSSVMIMRPVTYTCGQASVCPFCYARNVQELTILSTKVYKSITSDKRTDYWMAGYKQTTLLPQPGKKPMTLPQMFSVECKLRKKFYNSLKSFGGYCGTEFEPVSGELWKVTRKGMLLIAQNTNVSNLPGVNNVKLVKRYSRKRMAKLLGWLMRYPTHLMKGKEVLRVVQLLHHRKRHRLYASYGVFRKCKK